MRLTPLPLTFNPLVLWDAGFQLYFSATLGNYIQDGDMVFPETSWHIFDVATKQVVWVKARPDFDVLFRLLYILQVDGRRRFWILCPVADEDICDIGIYWDRW